MNTNPTSQIYSNRLGNSVRLFSTAILVLACIYCGKLITYRSLDVGTDTHIYANFFLTLSKYDFIETRLEPGFVIFTRLANILGLGINGFQAGLFFLLLLTIFFSTWEYYKYFGKSNSYCLYLITTISLLCVSPMFVNASINLIRQGLASLLLFTSLLFFYRRQWWKFIAISALSCSFHYSSLIYLAFAPVLLLSRRKLQLISLLCFIIYSLGLSELLVKSLLPTIYATVIDYKSGSSFRSGTRVDFAVFSIFWYLIPYVFASFIQREIREKVLVASSIYLTLLLPFFVLGFGNFSNRLLVPAWLSASLLFASLIFYSRIRLLRHPVFLWMVLIFSCGTFYYFVTNGIII